MLVADAKKNVRTWLFEVHTPTDFEVRFQYKLLTPQCDADCNCDYQEKESVLLHLPTEVQLNVKIPAICDPAIEIHRQVKRKSPSSPR